MTRRDPGQRPSAVEAMAQWRQIRRRIWLLQRTLRLHEAEETLVDTVVLDIVGFFRLGLALSRRFYLWTAHWCAVLRRTALPKA